MSDKNRPRNSRRREAAGARPPKVRPNTSPICTRVVPRCVRGVSEFPGEQLTPPLFDIVKNIRARRLPDVEGGGAPFVHSEKIERAPTGRRTPAHYKGKRRSHREFARDSTNF